ncbi:alpha/beta-hydrolase [Mycena vulgaris]|nr:alpha/beta-hydrolase [Mycena vulgaris]
MHLASTLLLAPVLAALALPLDNSTVLEKRTITTATYDDLVFYFQYASSAYSTTGCAAPNGNTLIAEFSEALTDTQGFIARDDTRKEIVVSMRGSSSFQDALIDVSIILIPFLSPGVDAPLGSAAHAGFLIAYNSVASTVLAAITAQLAAHPGYALVSTGHSLGGALSSLTAISLAQNFPGSTVRMYTYGQPRTFNPIGADFIDAQFGTHAFRSVHTTDGVPTIIPQILGYQHHGIEYWNFADPASPMTTRQCATSGEDPTCSDSIPSMGIDDAHSTYFNIGAGTKFCS